MLWPTIKRSHLLRWNPYCGRCRNRTYDPLLVRQMLWTNWANRPISISLVLRPSRHLRVGMLWTNWANRPERECKYKFYFLFRNSGFKIKNSMPEQIKSPFVKPSGYIVNHFINSVNYTQSSDDFVYRNIFILAFSTFWLLMSYNPGIIEWGL